MSSLFLRSMAERKWIDGFLDRIIFSILYFILQIKSSCGYIFINEIFIPICYLSYYYYYYYCTWCVCGVQWPHHQCGGQKTTLWSQSSPPTYTWVMGIKSGCKARSISTLAMEHFPCPLHSNILVGNSLNQWEPVWPIISITHEGIFHELLFSQINVIKYARRLYSSIWKRLFEYA